MREPSGEDRRCCGLSRWQSLLRMANPAGCLPGMVPHYGVHKRLAAALTRSQTPPRDAVPLEPFRSRHFPRLHLSRYTGVACVNIRSSPARLRTGASRRPNSCWTSVICCLVVNEDAAPIEPSPRSQPGTGSAVGQGSEATQCTAVSKPPRPILVAGAASPKQATTEPACAAEANQPSRHTRDRACMSIRAAFLRDSKSKIATLFCTLQRS